MKKRILLVFLVLCLLLTLAACTNKQSGKMVDLKCSRCGDPIQVPADKYDPEWTYICEKCDKELADMIGNP